MTKQLKFLAAWLPMRRGLDNIHSDWRAWNIGWNAGSGTGRRRPAR